MLRRREFLRGAAVVAAWPVASGAREPGDGVGEAPRSLIVRESRPENLETPFEGLDGPVTPTDRFYVRCHFETPAVDADRWRVKVEGAVDRALELSLDDLKALPSKTETALLECAGNGRVFLTPRAKGVAWGLGAVGNAEWTGVPLAAVLERAGVKSDAVEVILEGADSGAVADEPKSPGVIPFARSLPLSKARAPEVLLAYAMNGKPLTRVHGFPVRAVVPGWYGMASVKWLTRLVVTDRPFLGYFQTLDYSIFTRTHGLPSQTPLGEVRVKSAVARPARGEVVAAGRPYRVRGAAWTGDSEVARVEVSTDGGQSWADARLVGEPSRFSWRLWEFDWSVPRRPGPRTLLARATDRRGQTQSDRHDPDHRNYMIHHVVPVEVVVE